MDSVSANVGLSDDILPQLNSPESRALLDTIDSLRKLQVGKIINSNLPQIIVVGDQSSGKSSVLEAISRVRFPVDGDVCTRFATELVLRRAGKFSIDVSIHYADKTPSSSHDNNPPQPFRKSGFDKDSLPGIINEAKELMGLRKAGKEKFSKDILRVEISDPDVYPVTLVDLPGFFHSRTADNSPEDKEIVDRLVESYMKQEKSIILAVVAANNNLANQVVVEEAMRHDPKRERTLGVITKPDLAGSGANERKFLDLAQGDESVHQLTLGWFVLRNRSEDEKGVGFKERDLNEQRFFESGEWNPILRSNRGADSLREKLSMVLLDHIKTNLPGLIRDIEENLNSREKQLRRLGKRRCKAEELRLYLHEVADEFQLLARDAIDGKYSHGFFGDLYEDRTKLRALIRKLNHSFDVVMSMKGGAYKIKWEGDEDGGSDDDANTDGGESDDGYSNFPQYLQPFIHMYKDFEDPKPITESALNLKLESLAANNLGKEFPGTPNSDLAFQLFKMQAEPWEHIARLHLELTQKFCKAFVEQVFEHIIGPDKNTVGAILKGCVDPFFDEGRVVLEKKLQELLQPYTRGYGLPLETQFHAKLSRSTLHRLAGHLTRLLEEEHSEAFESRPKQGLSRETVLETILNAQKLQTKELGTDGIINIVDAYYEMSRITFTENVINLAVESCLVGEIPTILTTSMVYKMSEQQLKELASESDDVKEERQVLQKEAEILTEGLKKCQQNRMREMTVLPSTAPTTPATSVGQTAAAVPSQRPQAPMPTIIQTPPTSVLTPGASTSIFNAPPPGTGLFGAPSALGSSSSGLFSGSQTSQGTLLFGNLTKPSGPLFSNTAGNNTSTSSNAPSIFADQTASTPSQGFRFGAQSSTNSNPGPGTS